MAKYIMILNGMGRYVEGSPSSDEWGKFQKQFKLDVGVNPSAPDWPDTIHLWDHAKVGNVWYDEELAGSAGASFRVIFLPENTREEVDVAISQIRRDRDVVRLSVLRVKEII